MSCYLCGSEEYIEILNKQEVHIWTNASDERKDKKKTHKCTINQCKKCGHVYQPVTNDLRTILSEIYSSDNAQVSTAMGEGNWGTERARSFLDILDKIDLRNYKSALEIGCGNGYILRYLKNSGFEKLVGIEPSLSETEEIDGILFLKSFVDEKLRLPQNFDLVFSNGVFEHIEGINCVVKFCRKNLNDDGRLFFSVPNAQRQLIDGDPALFLHQHIHYYTRESLASLLLKNDFAIDQLTATTDAFIVSAKIRVRNFTPLPKVIFYNGYQGKLEKILMKIENILQGKNVIIHGANNALNNILGWLDKNFDFILVDNDNTKHGRRYFDRIVNSMTDFELTDYETVLIIPAPFYEIIKRGYIAMGFKGRFEGVLL